METTNPVMESGNVCLGKLDNNTLKSFLIGYSGNNNELYNYLKEKGFSEETMLASSLIGQNENGRMYDKFVGFIDDMKKIEKSIQMSHDAYNNAMNKLTNGSGNLVTKAQKLRAMGAKASKSLPENITTNI